MHYVHCRKGKEGQSVNESDNLNDKMKRIWKKKCMAYMKVLSPAFACGRVTSPQKMAIKKARHKQHLNSSEDEDNMFL
jgi:hypothetical protein